MKKFLSLVIALSILISCLGTASVFAAEETKTETYEEAITLLDKLCDASSAVDADSESPVSREAFIRLAAAAFRLDMDLTANVSFADVSEDIKPLLGTAVAMGLISDDTEFRPNDAVTYNEALKIVLTAAGLDVKAKYKGGYPSGYAAVAKEYDIDDDLGDVSNGLMPKDAYQIILNTLLTGKLEQTNFGDKYSYESSENETVLSDIWGIYVDEGVMDANEYTKFGTESSNGLSGTLSVNGVLYKTEDDFNNLLGYKVRIYYKDEKPTRRAFAVSAYDTETLTLLPDDDADYKNGKFIYYNEKGKEQSVDLARTGVEYIYNGKACYTLPSSEYIPDVGKIEFIDNNSDGKYEIVKISDYYYMTADTIDFYNKVILDEKDNAKKIDFSDSECAIKVFDTVEGEYIDPSALTAGGTLAVLASKDKMLYDITLLDGSASGIAKEYSSDDRMIGIETDDGVKNYDVAQCFIDEYEPILKVGEKYDFVIGIYGEVVSMSLSRDNMKYAFAVKAGDSGSLTKDYRIKLYSGGKFITAYFADRVSVDGGSFVDADDAFGAIGGNSFTPQVVKFALDSDDKLCRIDLAEEKTMIEFGVDKDPYNSLTKYSFPSTPSYRMGMFQPYFNSGGSMIMCIPKDSADYDNEDGYSMGTTFVDGTGNDITAYDISESGCAAFILVKGANEDTNTDAVNILMVEKIVSALDDDGMNCKKIYGWSNGSYVEKTLKNGIKIYKTGSDKLEPGDIIRYFEDKPDRIKKVIVDFIADGLKPNASFENSGEKPQYNCDRHDSHQYEYGYVYYNDKNYAYLTKALGDISEFPRNARFPSRLVEFNTTTRKLRTVDVSSIKSYLKSGNDASFVVFRYHQLSPRVGFIYTK